MSRGWVMCEYTQDDRTTPKREAYFDTREEAQFELKRVYDWYMRTIENNSESMALRKSEIESEMALIKFDDIVEDEVFHCERFLIVVKN